MLSQQELAEEARVRALRALGVLDTPQEDRFDRYTRIAAAAFGAPIALVSLVDAQRQWFKSRVGLDLCETPRSLAFCSHAIALDDLLVVNDTHLDERFADHPMVVGAPFVRFYAGQPVHSLDGQPLGTLCLLDQQPRQFGDAEKRMLRDLAQMVQDELNRGVLVAARDAAQMALRELNVQLERRIEDRTRELQVKHRLLEQEAQQRMKYLTELAESRAQAAESEERLRTIADNVPALIAYIDSGMRYAFANQRYQEWFGVKSADMLGKTVPEAMGEAFFAPRRAALERCLDGHASALEIEEERRGRRRVLSTTYLPHLRDGVVQGIYVLTTDATSAREYERQLHALAHSDHLTGLPNRRSYEERLAQAIARSRRSAMAMALVYLDLDHFKQINDSLGHASGDAVLREFGRRLSASVRATDTVARLAGDEFVIVLEQVGSARECARIADKLLEAMRPDFLVDGQPRQVSASIGIAWSAHPEHAALAHTADEALFQSKQAGRNTASVLVAGGQRVAAH
jgi:diguanylate cyclase (GGDEF)-like protein/PAS domain S-box-containing protein